MLFDARHLSIKHIFLKIWIVNWLLKKKNKKMENKKKQKQLNKYIIYYAMNE